MFTPRFVTTCVAVLIAIVGAATLGKQSVAKSCPYHDRYAGILATIIGWGLLIFSMGLVAFTWAFH